MRPTVAVPALTVPSCGDRDAVGVRPRRHRDRRHQPLAVRRGDAAAAVELEVAGARQAGAAVGQADLEEPGAGDGHGQRAVALLERSRAELASAVNECSACSDAHAAFDVVREVAETETQLLVAGRVDIRDVVRQARPCAFAGRSFLLPPNTDHSASLVRSFPCGKGGADDDVCVLHGPLRAAVQPGAPCLLCAGNRPHGRRL